MDNYQFNNFEEFIQFCNKSYNSMNNNNNNNNCDNCKFGNKNAEANESSRCADSDIPGGFQDIDPQLLLVGTSLLGAILAGKMPFNLQNVIGNWLELLGQVILTFNSQQQYFQGGPGRIYDPVYRNSTNPFCDSSSDETPKNTSSKTASNNSSDLDFNNLKNTIEALYKEIENLKTEVENLKKSIY